jgi:acetolactate synthase small subunit
MPKLKVLKAFSWAHEHVHVKEYAKGVVIETDDKDLIRVAKEEKWATDAGDAEVKKQIEQIEEAIADLRSKLEVADDGDKPGIEAELAQKSKELVVLQG